MDELLLKDAHEMRELLSNRSISAVELLTAHIEHIEQVDAHVNAIITTCFDVAMDQAKAIDDLGEKTGLLTGIPIPHKDLVATKNLRTTHGSTLFREHIPDTNDYIIDRMQRAGAITIGKTNVPEFGAGSHTFNRVFGPTKNPYNLERTCGGSSGGAAVALAMRMAALADGSDLGGSLRNPASFCNVIGFRPTNNILPPSLTADHSRNLASLGPMARDVDSVALLFEALRSDHPVSELPRLEAISLEGLRIAFTEDFDALPVVPEIRAIVRDVAAKLDEAGAIVEEASPDFGGARDIFQTLRGLSFRNRYDAFTPREKTELKPTILWNLALGISIDDEDLNRAQMERIALNKRIETFFQHYDLFVGPTTQVLPFPIPIEWIREIEGVQMNTYIDWMESCSWVTTTECPALSMPAGFADGLPVGVQLISRRASDSRLLRIAKSIESVISSASVLPDILCGD
ncbi:MAG: amidase family protein [Gammaproteobacteria bacterium]|nr:amidase family protein [Gammaproteobacteria bacterium]